MKSGELDYLLRDVMGEDIKGYAGESMTEIAVLYRDINDAVKKLGADKELVSKWLQQRLADETDDGKLFDEGFKYMIVQGTQVKWNQEGLEDFLKKEGLWEDCTKTVIDMTRLEGYYTSDDDEGRRLAKEVAAFADVVPKKAYVKVSKLKEKGAEDAKSSNILSKFKA